MTDSYKIEEAEKNVKNAFVAACVITIFTLIAVIASYFFPQVSERTGIDLWSLLDVLFVGGLAYGIYKQNRFAALSLTVYYIVLKIVTIFATGKASGIILGAVIAYYLIKGTIGAFTLHGIRQKEQEELGIPQEKSLVSKIIKWGAGIITVIFLGLILVGILAPDTKVLKGTEISNEYLDFVYDNGLLDEEEQVLYWYSDGFLSFKEGFYLLTREQVIIYNENEMPPSTHIPLTDLKYFEFYDSESEFSDSTIKLTLNNGEEYSFPVSNELGRGQEFFDRIALQNDIKVEGIE